MVIENKAVVTQLIVAEKPKVAQKIAYALGSAQKKNRAGVPYYEIDADGKHVIIAPAVGHIYTLRETKNPKWNLNYPVFDIEWVPSYTTERGASFTKKYLDNLKALGKGANEFVNACDYDVEGSVIGYNVLKHAIGAGKKDIKRMHFSTITYPDLREAYDKLEKFDSGQTEAGLTRHVLDWYYGINLSRALISALRKANARGTLSIGRVQGPALKLIVDREREILAFKPEPFWVLSALLNKQQDFQAVHIKEKFEKEEEATKAYEACKGEKTGNVKTVDRKQYKQPPPNPFDLTSLQVECHRHHRIAPKRTLEIGQSLYESGLISYPRTSSQQLPPTIGYRKLLEKVGGQSEYMDGCGFLLKKASLKPNNGKKTDPAHPAIYPTGESPQGLGSQEAKVYDLIVRRFMATFGEWAIRESMKVITAIDGEDFKSEGKRTVEKNWHELYGKYAKFEEITLPELKEGDSVAVKKVSKEKKMTQPPKRYTESSIISELEKRNLGTKATRATIIDTLFRREYLIGKPLQATELGITTVETLEKHAPDILDEQLTRDFEDEMETVMAGKKDGKDIEAKAKTVLVKICDKFKKDEKEIGSELRGAQKETAEQEAQQEAIGKCPVCGDGMLIVRVNPKTKKRFLGCSNYPKCTNTQPLPQKGGIQPAGKECGKCGYPIVNIWTKGKKVPWTICTNIKCPGKNLPAKPAQAAQAATGVKPAAKPAAKA